MSRYDTAVWDGLTRIGELEGRAELWRQTARAVVQAPAPAGHAPPAGLAATLRPYQLAGFGWLATLTGNGLGGVLADDMGLGKTVQTLALVAHVRSRAVGPAVPGGRPDQRGRDLAHGGRPVRARPAGGDGHRRGAAAGRSRTSRGRPTSWSPRTRCSGWSAGTGAVDWAGLVLDEAQTVKNHRAAAYRCARNLAAPFKLAITGTPLENNLMELWALFSLAAPGLLPTRRRFTDVYRMPVERARDGDRLAALRRRIAPLVLRRTKEQVAPDLPDKPSRCSRSSSRRSTAGPTRRYSRGSAARCSGWSRTCRGTGSRSSRSLTLLRQAALDIALVDPDPEPVPATKLDVLLELVDEVAAEGHRALVFSQFTPFLGPPGTGSTRPASRVVYLDGATRRRAEVIERFRSGTAPVFLISLKAGGTGLNLTEADYCIMLDPWWNPATEAQAVDRTHRIGQTRTVMVYRLVARDTIEEKVMALKAAKAELAASVLDGGDLASAALTVDDVRRLVG